MNFTIGVFIGIAEIAGCLRIRRWLGKLPARTGRRADGYDWIIDPYCAALRRRRRRN